MGTIRRILCRKWGNFRSIGFPSTFFPRQTVPCYTKNCRICNSLWRLVTSFAIHFTRWLYVYSSGYEMQMYWRIFMYGRRLVEAYSNGFWGRYSAGRPSYICASTLCARLYNFLVVSLIRPRRGLPPNALWPVTFATPFFSHSSIF